jgi:hypothetical protein
MDEDDPLIVRVGTFFLVVGGGAFLLFIMSDIADKVDFDFLFIAMVSIGIGWYFRRTKAPPPPAGRFEYLKKLRENANNKKAGKGKEKK